MVGSLSCHGRRPGEDIDCTGSQDGAALHTVHKHSAEAHVRRSCWSEKAVRARIEAVRRSTVLRPKGICGGYRRSRGGTDGRHMLQCCS